jgi:hypothetical protein
MPGSAGRCADAFARTCGGFIQPKSEIGTSAQPSWPWLGLKLDRELSQRAVLMLREITLRCGQSAMWMSSPFFLRKLLFECCRLIGRFLLLGFVQDWKAQCVSLFLRLFAGLPRLRNSVLTRSFSPELAGAQRGLLLSFTCTASESFGASGGRVVEYSVHLLGTFCACTRLVKAEVNGNVGL